MSNILSYILFHNNLWSCINHSEDIHSSFEIMAIISYN